ncbi:unnamed protein product [Caenorhabditis bovis]|uniref:Uncharacterized protein n=1 Tax=Caenorhabditis bovis TaxID=2654633 RepID=A0A8S1ELT4_9PELO|nr:unnamed protein product [Caenorhabditis bovis]
MPYNGPVTSGRKGNERTVLNSTQQKQYLTVPSENEIHRAGLPTQTDNDDKNTACFRACTCIAIAFIVCVLMIFVYVILITKFSAEPSINNDSLLAALIEPRHS